VSAWGQMPVTRRGTVAASFSACRSLYSLHECMTTESSRLSSAPDAARQIAGHFAAIPDVEAVVLSGSRVSQFADDQSDVDMYVYAGGIVPVSLRAEIARGAVRSEIGNSFWEPGDEWIDAESGNRVDIMFRATRWIEDQLDRVLLRHVASVGYSTCFWYNVRSSRALFDRSGWFKALQDKADRPYPEELKRAIVAKNHPILRSNMSSYLHQIELALQRHDAVSVNHRAAAMLASYFDIVFAVNEQPHPGEKRLLQFAQALCPKLPTGMAERAGALLSALPGGRVAERANTMLDGLDDLLRSTGLL
jgi:predicted nucleotidyltransferase